MRGEHFFLPLEFYLNPGSSPHARGALWNSLESKQIPRIIPACAGSTKALFWKDNPA